MSSFYVLAPRHAHHTTSHQPHRILRLQMLHFSVWDIMTSVFIVFGRKWRQLQLEDLVGYQKYQQFSILSKHRDF